jgi:hypothetical protein
MEGLRIFNFFLNIILVLLFQVRSTDSRADVDSELFKDFF